MKTVIRVYAVLLLGFGIVLGVAADRLWHAPSVLPGVFAQERGGGGRNPLPTMESLPSEVAQIKALLPSNSHIMMDVQFHWTELYFAAQKKNWGIAQFMYNEARGHIQWLIRKSPITRNVEDGKDVDIKGIFDGIDTSSLAAVKTAIEKKNLVEFNSAYKTMTESCYACHKSVGRGYLRPQIPTARAESVLNLDPNATWPQ
jgi:hypothetical protein